MGTGEEKGVDWSGQLHWSEVEQDSDPAGLPGHAPSPLPCCLSRGPRGWHQASLAGICFATYQLCGLEQPLSEL